MAQPALVETSGIAESRENDGLIWAHNDSGGNPELFAVGMDGSDHGRWAVPGAQAVDWEDMARGHGDEGVDRLYMADIGDNSAQRANVVVYRGTEPEVPAGRGRWHHGGCRGVDAHLRRRSSGRGDAAGRSGVR